MHLFASKKPSLFSKWNYHSRTNGISLSNPPIDIHGDDLSHCVPILISLKLTSHQDSLRLRLHLQELLHYWDSKKVGLLRAQRVKSLINPISNQKRNYKRYWMKPVPWIQTPHGCPTLGDWAAMLVASWDAGFFPAETLLTLLSRQISINSHLIYPLC